MIPFHYDDSHSTLNCWPSYYQVILNLRPIKSIGKPERNIKEINIRTVKLIFRDLQQQGIFNGCWLSDGQAYKDHINLPSPTRKLQQHLALFNYLILYYQKNLGIGEPKSIHFQIRINIFLIPLLKTDFLTEINVRVVQRNNTRCESCLNRVWGVQDTHNPLLAKKPTVSTKKTRHWRGGWGDAWTWSILQQCPFKLSLILYLTTLFKA